MSDVEDIRKALIYNQAEALRTIMDATDANNELKADKASLHHRIKCKEAEISALTAAKGYLAHQVALLEAIIDTTKCPHCGGDPFVRPPQDVRKAYTEVDEGDPD